MLQSHFFKIWSGWGDIHFSLLGRRILSSNIPVSLKLDNICSITLHNMFIDYVRKKLLLKPVCWRVENPQYCTCNKSIWFLLDNKIQRFVNFLSIQRLSLRKETFLQLDPRVVFFLQSCVLIVSGVSGSRYWRFNKISREHQSLSVGVHAIRSMFLSLKLNTIHKCFLPV